MVHLLQGKSLRNKLGLSHFLKGTIVIVYRSHFAGSEPLTFPLFTKFERFMATGSDHKRLYSFSTVYFGVDCTTFHRDC